MKNRIAETVLLVATVAATATLTTHIMQWHRTANGTKKATVSQTVGSRFSAANADPAMSAPYRDGLYVGRLAQERGEQRQPSVGRWATQADREAFSAGYEQSNAQIAEASGGN
ncbi:MAG: hypothetical protein ABLT11_01960 [Candidatus Acidiferrum sp.]